MYSHFHFKCVSAGTPAQTCHAITAEREVEGLETGQVLTFHQCSSLPCPFSTQGSGKPGEVWKRPLEPHDEKAANEYSLVVTLVLCALASAG